MQTSQLATVPGALRCRCCGATFEVSRRVESNPERMLGLKESIAAKHTCRKTVPVAQVRILRMPSKKSELEAYWNQSVARLMSA